VEKNYAAWHRLKSSIQYDDSTRLGYRIREVWWVHLGHNIGDEEDGKGRSFTRPVLIVKGFNRHIFWGVPLTSIQKQGMYYYSFKIKGTTTVSTALLSQLRTLDAKRLVTKLGTVTEYDLDEVKKRLGVFLA